MPYLIDSNILIDAKNRYYGIDFCPAFWDWIAREYKNEKLFSIDKIYKEIKNGEDELVKWADEIDKGFFLKTDEVPESSLKEVSNWVQEQEKYQTIAKQDFLKRADYFLVANAKARNYSVVTSERPEPNRKNKIKIPDVCEGLGIECHLIFEVLRKQKVRFILKK